ncbi:MAG: carbohydrate ABC transporter permease, partial [Nitrososphaeria archaeon]
LFCLIFTWNEFGAALILTGTNARTLPVQSLQFVASLGLDWGALCAAAVLIALPMIIFGLLIRRYLIRGLSLGAVR